MWTRRERILTLAIYRTEAITAEFFNEFTSMLELLVVYSTHNRWHQHPSGRSSGRQCHQVQRHLWAQPVSGRANSPLSGGPSALWKRGTIFLDWRQAIRLCSRSDQQQPGTFESRQQCGWHLLSSATTVTYHPTVPDDRCCTLAGSGPDPHPNRLL